MATDEPRWLDAEEEDAWIPLVAILLMLPAALESQLQRDAGLTFYEYVVLASLSSAGEDGLRMSDLAAATSAALSRVSQVVTRMEKRGWVARRPDPADARAARVVLLEGGRQTLVDAAPGHVDAVRRLVFDQLTAGQVRELRRISTKVVGTLVAPDSPLHARLCGRPALGGTPG